MRNFGVVFVLGFAALLEFLVYDIGDMYLSRGSRSVVEDATDYGSSSN